eukprot:m.137684 g.137684  ORF g.137684 m.137684 type:complete len:493 (-) comp9580_c0_seq1:1450-2928(-)
MEAENEENIHAEIELVPRAAPPLRNAQRARLRELLQRQDQHPRRHNDVRGPRQPEEHRPREKHAEDDVCNDVPVILAARRVVDTAHLVPEARLAAAGRQAKAIERSGRQAHADRQQPQEPQVPAIVDVQRAHVVDVSEPFVVKDCLAGRVAHEALAIRAVCELETVEILGSLRGPGRILAQKVETVQRDAQDALRLLCRHREARIQQTISQGLEVLGKRAKLLAELVVLGAHGVGLADGGRDAAGQQRVRDRVASRLPEELRKVPVVHDHGPDHQILARDGVEARPVGRLVARGQAGRRVPALLGEDQLAQHAIDAADIRLRRLVDGVIGVDQRAEDVLEVRSRSLHIQVAEPRVVLLVQERVDVVNLLVEELDKGQRVGADCPVQALADRRAEDVRGHRTQPLEVLELDGRLVDVAEEHREVQPIGHGIEELEVGVVGRAAGGQHGLQHDRVDAALLLAQVLAARCGVHADPLLHAAQTQGSLEERGHVIF